jgi:exonuclease III
MVKEKTSKKAPQRGISPTAGSPLLTLLLLFSIFAPAANMQSIFNGERVTFSCINSNSLNMSNGAKWNQSLKIYGIAKLKTDVIFLSDIRMSNKNLVSSFDEIKQKFLCNPYENYKFYANSSRNNRGVGILIKASLNLDILEEYKSEDENLLLLRVNLKGTELILISIYGPNSNNRNFFNTLSTKIAQYSETLIITGGDWNCTYSSNPLERNIDCLNMRRLPNVMHSGLLNDICDNFNVSDPFRYLYPEKREYSYVPRSVNNVNKSRLDFFIISDEFYEYPIDCEILPNLQNKLFDHKGVVLTINNKITVRTNNMAICNKELDDDLLEHLVYATVCETYLIHLRDEIAGRYTRNQLLEVCGRIKMLIRECGPRPELILGNNLNEIDIDNRARKIDRLAVLKNWLNLPVFESCELSCDADVFFEILLLNLKNEVVSHQSYMRKCKMEKMAELKKNIQILKENYIPNEEEILSKEKSLNNIADLEMRGEMEKYRYFDVINSEKMTPRFLTLSKINKKSDSLDIICEDSGAEFRTSEDRHRHIRDFYAKIYRRPDPGEQQIDDNTIPNFLGREICENPIVKNSKLSPEESESFDNDLTIQELDSAIQSLNEKSAGGADGISTKFLKRFWPYLRTGLHRYTGFCFANKRLTQSTNSAVIKLIPKKGDLKQIKNWRPISLLNSVFKIISKARDNRLKKINDIILSRAQKGFTSKRYIQECIINITETINQCEADGVPGFVLALDMAKAFDTVHHEFATAVYKFFGLGTNLINILNTITMNRTAAIMLDDGRTTEKFELGTGFTQGNNPSPKQFNMVAQVLIFKIEFDPNIVKIYRAPVLNPGMDPAPAPAPALNPDLQANIINAIEIPVQEQIPVPLAVSADPDPDPQPRRVPAAAININRNNVLEPMVQGRGAEPIALGADPDPGQAPAPALDPGPGPVPAPVHAINLNIANVIELPVRNQVPEPVDLTNPDPVPEPDRDRGTRAIINEAAMPVQIRGPEPVALDPDPDPDPGNATRVYGSKESKKETGKLEAFADDKTAMGKATPLALESISNTLEKFADISGLKCNMDKSMIMIIGTNGIIPDYVYNSGFQIVQSVKILGFDISRNFADMTNNFNPVIEKITKIIRFWDRFRLSLPGRINVAKTLMLSQVSYHGSIINPTNDQLQEIQTSINKFVTGKLKISKNFIDCGIEKGGLGMVNVSEFITGLQSNWVKRSLHNTIDLWRYDLNSLSNNNVLTLDPDRVDPVVHPIKHTIASAWFKVKRAFYLRNNNFDLSFVLGNPLLFKNKTDKIRVDDKLFVANDFYKATTANLKVSELLDATGKCKNQEEVQHILNFNVDIDAYNKMQICINDSRKLSLKNNYPSPDHVNLEAYIARFKKGSRPFRRLLENLRNNKIKCKNKQTVKTFFRLIDMPLLDEPELEVLNKQWADNCYSNRLREFAYKFRNNLLGLNTHVSHFNANISRGCTFCNLNNTVPVPDETFKHLFFSRPVTRKVLDTLHNQKLSDMGCNSEQELIKFYFLGTNPRTSKNDNYFLSTIALLTMQFIWECKLKKTKPVYQTLLNDMYFLAENIRRMSNKMRAAMTINLALCRSWYDEAHRRR